jgi:hypothetical protein
MRQLGEPYDLRNDGVHGPGGPESFPPVEWGNAWEGTEFEDDVINKLLEKAEEASKTAEELSELKIEVARLSSDFRRFVAETVNMITQIT